jgi:predicted aspartyl protease
MTWVYGKKVQLEALVDSGATTIFINKRLVKSNNLLMHKLASPFNIINADGTSNKSGQITDAIRCYLEIGTHKSKNQILVTDLGSKDMILGMSFL